MDVERLLPAILIILALAFACAVESSLQADTHWEDDMHFPNVGHVEGISTPAPETCVGLLGECTNVEDDDDEDDDAGMISRRTLAQGGRYISYGALRRNNVPCNRRGHSYYNCARSGKANPYRRGCSAITRCARTSN
ncbi:protein RALF-like 22 [Malania oleifera]|uniref:protein RALF-like 22 n=1 Tax=Malania oleifera TaxID=397392 RepID=UPI0025ADCBC2|nr:protein RALF-like 22 [Malania oleifera]